MNRLITTIITLSLAAQILLPGSIQARKARIYVYRGTSILPMTKIRDSLLVKSNMSAIKSAKRGHVYCYLDTVRYLYVEKTNMPQGSMASIDFYQGDTVSIKICFESLEDDSLYVNVNNNLPAHLDFTIYKYSDFTLTNPTAIQTGDLTFIYRGQSPDAGYYPTITDSSNFYIRRNGFMHSAFYDITGLDTGIYDISPTLDIFSLSDQEQGYESKEYIQVVTSYGSIIDSVSSRRTEPIYIRPVKGIIDTLNLFMDKAYRFALDDKIDSSLFYMRTTFRMYRGSVDACKMMAIISEWFDYSGMAEQYWTRMEDYIESKTDWYRERFRTINGWTY